MLVSFLFLFHVPALAPEVIIAYQVLEVFPTSRRVLVTCHSPQVTPPITYSLWGSQDIEVAKKVVKSHDPASFSINVTLKSRPDLLTYTCQAATSSGTRVASTKLQMYWELWASECVGVGPVGCRVWKINEAPGSGKHGDWGLGQEVAHLPGPPSAPGPGQRLV